ncbi:MAG: DEAD/DEAH box helicase, partial [Ktedonobacterales bacterium]
MSQGTSAGALTPDTAPDGTTLELRGRDLLLHPPASVAALGDIALLDTLFGRAEASGALARLTRDRRGRFFRARPMDFATLKAGLLAGGAYPLHVAFEEDPALPWQPVLSLTPRPYQEDALTAWRAEGYRGVVVLPTGGGKTFIGALAIADLNLRTLVVVPTIDLLRQWRAALAAALSREPGDIGIYGGGDHDVQPITIVTYESAQIHPELLRRFGLLIFDECHHLPAPTYRQIAEGAFTPHRLGLSATPERADQEHAALVYLIGPEVYRRHPEDLAATRHLAAYDEHRLVVSLTPDGRLR